MTVAPMKSRSSGIAPAAKHEALARRNDVPNTSAVNMLAAGSTYRDGDPAARLLHLSTFLGHVDPASTALYLTITADLLKAAGERFERFTAPLSTVAVR